MKPWLKFINGLAFAIALIGYSVLRAVVCVSIKHRKPNMDLFKKADYTLMGAGAALLVVGVLAIVFISKRDSINPLQDRHKY